MSPHLIFSFINLAIGLVAIPWYIKLAHKKKLIDVPNHRSSHTTPTPRGGGVFLVAGSLILFLVYSVLNDQLGTSLTFLASGASIAFLGFIDDIKSLPSKLRLVIQLLLAAFLFSSLQENSQFIIFNFQLPLWLAVSGVTVWIVGCLNIYNFMDGIDGIATVQGLVTTTIWCVIGYNSNSTLILFFSLLLASGLLAFLIFNWSPAKVFMGDCASSFLGFSFAALPLLYASLSGTDAWLAINIGALALFPFLFDGTFTLFRRAYAILIEDGQLKIKNGKKLSGLMEAHREHLYQRWHQRGASHRFVSSIYGIWAIISGASALLVHFQQLSLPSAYLLALLPATIIVTLDRTPRRGDC